MLDDSRRPVGAVRWAVPIVLAVLPAGIYATGALALASLEQTDWSAVVCYDPRAVRELTAARFVARLAMALGAVLFLFAGPWLSGIVLLRRWPAFKATAHAWSLVLNSVALVATCLLLRNSTGIERTPFCAAWLVWNFLLVAFAARRGSPHRDFTELGRSRGIMLGCAVSAALVGGALLWNEHFRQCFDGDGVETYELAASLRSHFLPTWQIETTGEFGPVIVNPSLINSYWTLAVQVLLGAGEFSTRFPYWVYWIGILLACDGLLPASVPVLRRIVLVLVLGLSAVWYTFSVGYDPYMADLANPGVPDALFTLLFVLALDCLRRGDPAGWVACLLCASLVLYAGPVLFVLTAVAGLIWPPVERWRMFRATVAGTVGLLLIAGSYIAWGWYLGLLADWYSTLEGEYVREYFAPLPRWSSGALFLGYFVLGSGGIPAWGVVRAWSGSAWERATAAAVLGYLAIILGAAVKNLHYLGPLIPLTVVLWALRPARERGARRADWAAVLTVAACIFASWPRERPVFTLTRELGTGTTFQVGNYAEACQLAELAVIYDMRIVSWEVGPHTWVYYSNREPDPANQSPLLVTADDNASAGYAYEANSPFGVWLYLRDREWLVWAASREPLAGPDRAPIVFQPIANRPRPRLVYRPLE